MSAIRKAWTAIRDVFGSPHPPPYKVLLEMTNDLSPDRWRDEAERQYQDIQRRLERLKAEVDVHRRDA